MGAPGHGHSAGNSLHLEVSCDFLAMLIADLKNVHAIIAHSLGSLVAAYAFIKNECLPVKRYIVAGAPKLATSRKYGRLYRGTHYRYCTQNH
jgi:pimeloyl-ACP methyl ester carboxylesterase